MARIGLAALLCLSSSLIAAEQKLVIGQPAPGLRLRAVLGSKSDVGTLEGSRGRVVVLVFWATWCSGSRAAIPHLNRVASELAGDPVSFLAITSESEAVVEPFLKREAFKLPIGLDDQGMTAQAFGATWVPKVVVVDRLGIVRGIVVPEDLTAERIRSVASGQPPGWAVADYPSPDLDWDRGTAVDPDASDSAMHVVVRRSGLSKGAFRAPVNSGTITGDGLLLSDLVLLASGAHRQNYEVRTELPTERYRISIKARTDEDARRLLMDVLLRSFPIAVLQETQPREVVVFRKGPAVSCPEIRQSKGVSESGAMISKYGANWKKGNMTTLVAALSGVMFEGFETIDETSMTDDYDFAMTWASATSTAVVQAFAECGINITRELRPRTVIVVEGTK